MGRTVRFDQIFVTSLDAAPRETDVLSGLASIDAGEITADQIQVANLTITNKVTANVESTEFTGLTNVYRFTATQVGIGTDNPTNEFQLGSDSVIMNRNLQDLVTIQGNTVSTNLFATSTLKTTNDKFFADANASNVLNTSSFPCIRVKNLSKSLFKDCTPIETRFTPRLLNDFSLSFGASPGLTSIVNSFTLLRSKLISNSLIKLSN